MRTIICCIFIFVGISLSAQNMITNGDFESGFSSWTNLVGGTGVATFSLGTGSDVESGTQAMKVVVTTASANAYDIQSINAAWASVSGTSYTLTLWAKSSVSGAQIKLVQQNTTYAEKILTLTTTYTQYSWTFTAGESGLNFKLNFPQVGTFDIDNINIPNPNPIVAPATTTVTVTPATTYQTMEGFGGAMSWYSSSILNASTATQTALYQLLFNDLGLDILRLKNWYFPVNYPTDKTTSNLTDNASYNAGVQFFKQAKAINPNIDVLLCSWTPPAYLKSNDSLNAGTLKKDGNGKFMYSQYAQYWNDILTAYSNSGMNPDFISIQNEPGFVNTGWETCAWRPSETSTYPSYAIGFDSVYNRVKKLSKQPKMIGPEVENIGTDADWNNANTFTCYTDSFKSHAGLYAYAYHLYNFGGANATSILSTGTSTTLNTVQSYSDKQNFMTEFSTDWYDLALMIMQDVNQANASAYIHWELVWGDATDTNTAVLVNSSGAYTVEPPYYTLKHFAKFVDKGYQRVNIASTNSFVIESAFKNPSKNEVTIVAVNNATTSTTTSFSLGSSLTISAMQAYQSVYGNYYQTISGLTATSTVTMPAQSITTIVIDYTAAAGTTPTVSFSAPANNSNYCSGSSVTITALPTITTGSISKVDFYDGTTLLGTVSSSPYTYTWTNPSIGSHTLGVIATSAASVASTEATETITVNALPTVSAGSAVAICNGSSTTLTATGGSSYKWSNAATTASTTVSPTATTTYTVTGTNAGGCTATSSVAVTVNALPTISAGSAVSICNGSSTTLTATGGSSYKWSNAATTASTTVSPTATTTYTVTGTNAGGCTATSSVAVTLNALPTISAGSAVSICNGSSTTLTATGGASYKWSNAATTASTTVSPTATTTYTVTGTNAGGCTATSSIKVTVNAIPAAPTVTSPVNYTTSATATALTATGTNLLWYTVATGGTGTATAPIPSTTTVGTTDYYVSQTTNNCESPRATIVVTVTQGNINQSISLLRGWNFISFYVSPSDKTIATVFASVLSNVTEIKNADAFWSSANTSTAFNSLTQISDGGAYLVYMKIAGTLTVTGLPITLPFTTTLKSGWNMVGIPMQSSISIPTTLSGMSINTVKDFDGFWQLSGTPSITTFDPGKGYFIQAAATTTLSW